MSEQDIFLEAFEKDPADRAAFLEEACGGDVALRSGVEALLRLSEEAPSFLQVPAIEQLAAGSGGSTETAPPTLTFLSPSAEPGSLGRLDHYEILGVVGRGGMGVVLRARDAKLERVVAIKVLAPALAASGSARKRFAREARAAAAVRDDHVIAIHAVCDEGPVPYLVMEFIDGSNLETLVRKNGPLEAREILRIGIQAASGLAAAHRQGLIHRDVKPANILLENGVQRVKLTDFGLARAADDASMTQSGLVAGTPLYMAPEQASGEAVDHRADLFSLGSVLYELCTGRPAFRAPTTMAVLRRVCEDSTRPVREVNADIPEPLASVIERLHSKTPAGRFVSASEVADRLAEILAGLEHVGAPTREGEASAEPKTVAQRELRPPDSRPETPAGRVAPRKFLWAAGVLALLSAGLALGEGAGVTNLGAVVRLFSPMAPWWSRWTTPA